MMEMSKPVTSAPPSRQAANAVTASKPGAEIAQPPPTEPAATPARDKASQLLAADLRLIIEESDSGHYVYTVVDRRTGEVISQLPREEVLRLKDQPGYSAGDLYKGRA